MKYNKNSENLFRYASLNVIGCLNKHQLFTISMNERFGGICRVYRIRKVQYSLIVNLIVKEIIIGKTLSDFNITPLIHVL